MLVCQSAEVDGSVQVIFLFFRSVYTHIHECGQKHLCKAAQSNVLTISLAFWMDVTSCQMDEFLEVLFLARGSMQWLFAGSI